MHTTHFIYCYGNIFNLVYSAVGLNWSDYFGNCADVIHASTLRHARVQINCVTLPTKQRIEGKDDDTHPPPSIALAITFSRPCENSHILENGIQFTAVFCKK